MTTSEERQRKALWLRQRLRALGLTQEQAAERVGVTPRTLQNWLAGIGPIRKSVMDIFKSDEEISWSGSR